MIKDKVAYMRRMVDLMKNDFNRQVYNMMVDHYWRIPYGSTERSECDEILNELKPWMGIYWEINKFYENR